MGSHSSDQRAWTSHLVRCRSRITGMRGERRYHHGHPHMQWHRGQNLLELVLVIGTPESKSAPFPWRDGRLPESQQVALSCEFPGVSGLSRPGGLDDSVGCALGNMGNHVGKKLHNGLL